MPGFFDIIFRASKSEPEAPKPKKVKKAKKAKKVEKPENNNSEVDELRNELKALKESIFATPEPEPEPVDDLRVVLGDMWADREARKDAETRRRIQFDAECG